jgi:hypothetical protein
MPGVSPSRHRLPHGMVITDRDIFYTLNKRNQIPSTGSHVPVTTVESTMAVAVTVLTQRKRIFFFMDH